MSPSNPKIALLIHYAGGNIGDATLLRAAADNLRALFPGADLRSITLNPKATAATHGIGGECLFGVARPFYGGPADDTQTGSPTIARRLYSMARSCKRLLVNAAREIAHWGRALSFMRRVDVLVVTGSGQLTEQFGGPLGHPYSLYKWTLAASIMRTRIVFLSIGVGQLESRLGRFLCRRSLRRGDYVSVRDPWSQEFVRDVLGVQCPVMPDLAFSLPLGQYVSLPATPKPRTVGLSPTSYGHPLIWPQADAVLYNRYLDALTAAAVTLIERGHAIVLFATDGPDATACRDLADRVEKNMPGTRLPIEAPRELPHLLRVLGECHTIVTSRFHGAVLSHLLGRPVLAIHTDHRLPVYMGQLTIPECSMSIRDVDAERLREALDAVLDRREWGGLEETLNAWRQQARDQYLQALDSQRPTSPERQAFERITPAGRQ